MARLPMLPFTVAIGVLAVTSSSWAEEGRVAALASTRMAVTNPVTFAAKSDAPVRDAPSASFGANEASGPSPVLGVRLGFVDAAGDMLDARGKTLPTTDFIGGGKSFQLDAGIRLGRSWVAYGFWEHAFFSKGEKAGTIDLDPYGNAVGLGLQARTNTNGPVGFYFDVGAALRWVTFANSLNGKSVAQGLEPLRLALGASVVVTRNLRIDVGLGISAGYFSEFRLGDGCVNQNPTSCDTIAESNRKLHVFRTLSIGGSFAL